MLNHWVSAPEDVQRSLGSHLVEAGLLTEAQTKVISADQAASGMSFSEIAVFRGWVKEQTVRYLIQKVIIPTQMSQDLQSLQQEKDALKRERDTLRIERDTLRIERDTLYLEKESLRIDKSTAELERGLAKQTHPPLNTAKQSTPPVLEDDDDVRWVG